MTAVCWACVKHHSLLPVSPSVAGGIEPPGGGGSKGGVKQVEPAEAVEAVASDEELQRLRELLKQRDDEISILATGTCPGALNTCTLHVHVSGRIRTRELTPAVERTCYSRLLHRI